MISIIRDVSPETKRGQKMIRDHFLTTSAEEALRSKSNITRETILSDAERSQLEGNRIMKGFFVIFILIIYLAALAVVGIWQSLRG
jgi:hypothetical protein